MTSLPEDKWYKDGLGFECQRCGKCCGGQPGFVWITEEDISNIASALGMTAEEAMQRCARRIGSRLSLKEKPDADCILLEKGACTVYEVRPVQCRTFPFWPLNLASPETWEGLARKCPGINNGKLRAVEEIEDAMARKF